MQSSSISYQSNGHLLIIGPEDLAHLTAGQIRGTRSITLLAHGAISNQDESHLEQALASAQTSAGNLQVIHTPLVSLKGWLGQFELLVRDQQQNTPFNPAKALIGQLHFDLVLDLSDEPVIPSELAPAGYFHVAAGSHELQAVIPQLGELQGEFEKPAYIAVNSSICAHADRGQTGCTRCLDVCPADAISSHNNTPTHDFAIAVNTALCHGAGSCTTACPTGALAFVTPQPQSQLSQLRQLVDTYRQQGGERPALLIHAHQSPPELEQLPDFILPLALEEAAGVGIEIWMSLLAAGCTFVAIQLTDEMPNSLRQLLQKEVALAGQLLTALGHPAQRIQTVEDQQLASRLPELDQHLSNWHNLPASDPFEWEGKRGTLNAALERLFEQGEALEAAIALPSGAPYGQVLLNTDACTLCMSCVALCPTGALRGNSNEQPRLAFLEADCVQCGLCERSCPERAISLEARFTPAPGERLHERVLKEEQPFHCISCGKPFGSHSTITGIMKKLQHHSYFQGEAAKRLQMCEDCRVRDSYRELAADPEAQLRL
ncbi:4Fe-4S binding protein [Marinospirillum alkaliphilum]|uniref:Ferredoxin n=1 Tax=Marinospirillum alkaliphilum DSM 21637 TaxID=1122209 RepID=A0A1K1XZQ3_9GAMM|nr:4Fe-4S binding protein [Marinospirillum alkaliphilum]SFX55241.1 Ferredoxin [Marinospirillum alkaliphilum DSM 21637]